VWCGRNITGSVIVTTLGILVLGQALRLRERAARDALPGVVRRVVRERGAEMAALVVATVAIYLTVFDWATAVPVAFPLLVPTVWAAMRFSPAAVAVHSVAVAGFVVAFTIQGRGPFSRMDSWQQEALISQLFIGLVFSVGMLVSLSRSERLSLTGELRVARARSESRPS